jgi:hypothetical protein
MNIEQIIPADGWGAYTEDNVFPLVCWAMVDMAPVGGMKIFGMCLDSDGKNVVRADEIKGFRKFARV